MTGPTQKSNSPRPAGRPRAPSPGRKGRPRADDDKRLLIIRAARQLLKLHKPANITRDAIARTAGVDPALIRYYFGDRSALLREVVWQTTDELHAKLEALSEVPGGAIDRLRARLKVWLEVFASNPHYSELVVENVFYGDQDEGRHMLKTFVRRALPDLEKLVAEGVAAGEIRNVEPRFVYLTLIALAEYYATAAPLVAELFGSRTAVTRNLDAYGDYAADLLIDGLRRRD